MVGGEAQIVDQVACPEAGVGATVPGHEDGEQLDDVCSAAKEFVNLAE